MVSPEPLEGATMCGNRQIMLRLAVALLLALAAAPVMASGGGKKPAGGHGKAGSGAHGKAGSAGHDKPKKEAKKQAHGSHKQEKQHKEEESPASKHVADVERILALIADKERRHDPRLYMEVDLGEFRVTRPGTTEDDIVVVQFQVFGVLNEQDRVKFEESVLGRQQRLRDAVLSVVHRSELDQLMDPALDAVKSELVAAINRILENDFLRDVAFSTFSM
jgi:flagellar basal body-associated protein FliL